MRRQPLFRFVLTVAIGVPAGHGVCAEALSASVNGPVLADVIRVIDGDTVLVSARPWPQQRVDVYVRLRGIDAPEIHSRCVSVRLAGERARDALDAMTRDRGAVSLSHISADKYFGRVVADMTTPDGANPANELLSAGYVVSYDGGTKRRESCAQ